MCLAHRKSDGKPCGGQPRNGSDVCRMHGGGASQVKAKAAERVRQAEIVEAARVYGVPREVEPAVGILEEIWRTAGTISWLGEIVAGLKQEDIVFGTTRLERSTGTGTGQSGGDTESTTAVREAKLNLWVDLLFRERKHFADICAKAVSLGLAERELAFQEQLGHLFSMTMRAILGDEALGLTPAQLEKAPGVVVRHLGLVVPSERAGEAPRHGSDDGCQASGGFQS
jgi:hypothetical protein